MTREQKIEWLANATAEQLLEQFRRAVNQTSSSNIATSIEGDEDSKLVEAELLKRLG